MDSTLLDRLESGYRIVSPASDNKFGSSHIFRYHRLRVGIAENESRHRRFSHPS